MRKESKVLIYLLRGYPNLRDCKPLLLLKDKLVYCAKKLGKRNDLRKAYSNFQDKVKEKSITLSSSSKNKLENLLSKAQTIKVTILEEIKLLNLRL